MTPLIRLVLLKSDGKWALNDTAARSVVKTVTWRVTGSTATFLIAYLMTGNFAVASVIGVAQMISNTVLYYIHERLWNRITWGSK
jgi:uncharacterized membrane protein